MIYPLTPEKRKLVQEELKGCKSPARHEELIRILNEDSRAIRKKREEKGKIKI